MLTILYLVHDINEPAVRRRVLMLQAGGAYVTLAGFTRGNAVAAVGDIDVIDLGQTRDGDFVQRMVAVSRAAARARSYFGQLRKPELIIARNLEMLAIASRVKRVFGGSTVPVVYECLDIHRLVLRKDLMGTAMRRMERSFARNASLLVTSSPAFLREYFQPYRQYAGPVELLENKHLELQSEPGERMEREPGPPWRIGWFGALRCHRSLEILSRFASQEGGRFEVLLRGRPAATAIPDFQARVDQTDNLDFGGPYRNPEDISHIYRQVHFSWVIDFFEEGQNSKWLLPNRLYEGCRFGAVPIALAGTEIARVLADLAIGIVLPEATPECLADRFKALDPETYRTLQNAVLAHDAARWVSTKADCNSLVDRLSTVRDRRVSLSGSHLMEMAS